MTEILKQVIGAEKMAQNQVSRCLQNSWQWWNLGLRKFESPMATLPVPVQPANFGATLAISRATFCQVFPGMLFTFYRDRKTSI